MKPSHTILAGALVTTFLLTSAASGQSLLGLVGGSDSGALITLGSGEAGGSGLVNVGLGGGGGNVLDANIGGGSGGELIGANVSTGGDNGLLDVNANVGDDLVMADIGIGGSSGPVVIDIGIGGPTGPGGPGTPGGPTGPGRPGVPGTNGAIGSASGSGGSGANVLRCVGADPSTVLALFSRTPVTSREVSNWYGAGDVQIFPVKLCDAERRQLAATLAGQPKLGVLQSSLMSAPAISSALSRSGYTARDAFAVVSSFNRVTVYVY